MSQSGEIAYTFRTSPHHRIYHADGMYGGNTSQNRLVVSFYAERPQEPNSAVLKIENGQPAGPEKLSSNGFPIREIEASVSLDLNLSISFYVWLEDKIRTMTSAAGMPREELDKMLEGLRGGNSSL